MNTKQLLAGRVKLQAELKKAKDITDKKWTALVEEWSKTNLFMKLGGVYDIVGKEGKRKGYTRFVVYDFDYKVFMGDSFMVRACGWWLDADNNPAKWDCPTIYGIGNPVEFEKSKNQKNNKVPNHLAGRQ